MLARVVHAQVNLTLTQAPREPRITLAREIIDSVDTGPMHAQVGSTIISVDLTPGAHEGGGALTGETVEGVPAGPPVVAGVAGAIIDIGFTVSSAESIDTSAMISVDSVGAVAVILAGVRAAFVIVHLTVLSFESLIFKYIGICLINTK